VFAVVAAVATYISFVIYGPDRFKRQRQRARETASRSKANGKESDKKLLATNLCLAPPSK